MDTYSTNAPHETVQFSTRMRMDGKLADISYTAIEELCALCNKPCPEGVIENPVLNQLHDALTLMRAGILRIEHDEHDKGTRVLVLTISPIK